MSTSLWIPFKIAHFNFQLLNLDHPCIETDILDEIEAGVDVYYDRRWTVTEAFCHFLIEQPEWVADRSVMVLGAGIGIETLVIGRLCKKIYINDLAPTALDLCARQLRKNGMGNVELLPGRYEAIDCPPVDIIVGCYIVYNPDTAKALKQFLNLCPCPILLMNEYMSSLQTLLKTTSRRNRSLLSEEPYLCILFE